MTAIAEFETIYEEHPTLTSVGFGDMELSPEVLRGIYGYGYESPSEIQKQAIIPMIAGRDIIGQARAGSGKTATFVIGTLERIDRGNKQTQAIVLCHSRELAEQTAKVFRAISEYTNISIHVSVGGVMPPREEIKILTSQKPQVIIGTTGRVSDMIRRGALNTDHIKMLVIDEADEMLKDSSIENVQEIYSSFKQKPQSSIFSATLPEEIVTISKCFQTDPLEIRLKTQEVSVAAIDQYFVPIEDNPIKKANTILALYETMSVTKSIIFVNTKKTAEDLGNYLHNRDFAISVIHGDMPQDERERVVKNFRDKTSVLISTDLLSRGFDDQQVSLVINFDIPRDTDSYIHRVGRSGRFGRTGIAINLVSEKDAKNMEAIEKKFSLDIKRLG